MLRAPLRAGLTALLLHRLALGKDLNGFSREIVRNGLFDLCMNGLGSAGISIRNIGKIRNYGLPFFLDGNELGSSIDSAVGSFQGFAAGRSIEQGLQDRFRGPGLHFPVQWLHCSAVGPATC